MIGELLFWLHFAVIPGSIVIGIIFLLPTLILLIILHRLHIHLLGECILSRLQKYLGVMPKDLNFLQFASQKILRKNITRLQSKIVDSIIVFLTIAASSLKYVW